jgi:membrane dipeptidase
MSTTAGLSSHARALLGDAIVWDNHGCMPMHPSPAFMPQLDRYRASGCSIVSLNAGYGVMGWDEHVLLLDFMRQWLLERPEDYLLVHTAEDVALAKRTSRLGVVFDVEGMVPVLDDPYRVRRLYGLGVRWMLVAYNRANAAGGGCLDDDDGGLTSVGRRIIDEMDAAGMVLCLSHTGARTAREALEHTRNPAILSHSNPLGLIPHPRNVSDELIKACAAKGGVIGLNGVGRFLGTPDDALVPALLRHIRYVVDLVGSDHVGLGIDYLFDTDELEAHIKAHPAMYPPDLCESVATVEPEAMPQIVEGLCELGLSDAAVRAILGENWLRIARQVWK